GPRGVCASCESAAPVATKPRAATASARAELRCRGGDVLKNLRSHFQGVAPAHRSERPNLANVAWDRPGARSRGAFFASPTAAGDRLRAPNAYVTQQSSRQVLRRFYKLIPRRHSEWAPANRRQNRRS